MEEIKHKTKHDEWAKRYIEAINAGKAHHMRLEDGLILRNDLIYVPSDELRVKVMQQYHDSAVGGHAGIQKTIELITRTFWWPSLNQFVIKYIQSCETCAMSKSSRHKPYGPLMPIPIPNHPWKSISLDFITDLPSSAGYDCIMVVVDRFTKMAYFEPCSKSITAKECAKLLLRGVFRLHGIPDEVIIAACGFFKVERGRKRQKEIRGRRGTCSSFIAIHLRRYLS